ncbi:MAG: aldo/keto reductase [Deltaproteobacteria bacterium]|nr:aldo/keto reductase [Deltaproteobacteria bacterium]
MLYRRFGRTGLAMPVFSCGGMRFQQSWTDGVEVTAESQRNLEAIVERALALGINHFETARGYGTSGEQLGRVLRHVDRGRVIVQTKVGPTPDARDFESAVERAYRDLGLEQVDLFAVHGINDRDRFEWTFRKGGCMEKAVELKRQGRARWLGFSTHAPLPLLLEILRDGRFDFVNLHWYWVFQRNLPAIEEATRQDMGVFIISPTDKGGRLYSPSEKLRALVAPLSPIVFNDAWTLAEPRVHTLSVGAERPTDFDEHVAALEHLSAHGGMAPRVREIADRLQGELEATLGREWVGSWDEGLPEWCDAPGEINVREILRLRNLALALDMHEYGKARYNLLSRGDHWFPGNQAGVVSELEWSAALARSPHAAAIAPALREAHALLAGDPVKRLGSH